MTGYFEAYIRELNKNKYFGKSRELNELENQFDESPCPDLAQLIISGYRELAGIGQGWQQKDMSFAYSKAKRYEQFLNKLN